MPEKKVTSPHLLDYASPRKHRTQGMVLARVVVVVVGILLPYLARIPGMASHGMGWLTQYFFGDNLIIGILEFAALNSLYWGLILVASFAFQCPASIYISAIIGFVYPAIAHSSVKMMSDPQSGVALIFIPIESLPFTGVGLLVGWMVDRTMIRGRS